MKKGVARVNSCSIIDSAMICTRMRLSLDPSGGRGPQRAAAASAGLEDPLIDRRELLVGLGQIERGPQRKPFGQLAGIDESYHVSDATSV